MRAAVAALALALGAAIAISGAAAAKDCRSPGKSVTVPAPGWVVSMNGTGTMDYTCLNGVLQANPVEEVQLIAYNKGVLTWTGSKSGPTLMFTNARSLATRMITTYARPSAASPAGSKAAGPARYGVVREAGSNNQGVAHKPLSWVVRSKVVSGARPRACTVGSGLVSVPFTAVYQLVTCPAARG